MRVTPEARRAVLRAAAVGGTQLSIAEVSGCSKGVVWAVMRSVGGVIRKDMLMASPGRLSMEDRVEIRIGLERAWSFTEIARQVGVSTSTVSREVARHGGRDRYRPVSAHIAAEVSRRRAKPAKLSNPILCEAVSEKLTQLCSPEQISARLRVEFPDRPEMWVSHETIYQSLYVQGRGALRKELTVCLRTGRALRKPRQRVRGETRGKIANMINISERPAEVADRAVPGHWEGDLIVGKDSGSAIGTLVERTTRYVILLHLPGRHGAEEVRDAMLQAIPALPKKLWRSLTWDQGVELTRHCEITIASDLDIYFCDPHSPWQRGSNENTNGLLRQYFPKSTDLSVHSAEHVAYVAGQLNGRPRQTLGFRTPTEAIRDLLSQSTQPPGVATTP